ncbi:restriction endonuclease subunit S [Pseudolactococcus reticulitermitis]|uniref:Type I restriction modification DNA specificity domain-containing protein n=1 Tax=Pseudolactococcus reticulitermitis TaxID=2025039 RepID=A0A224WXY5_9LACT|nr:restriction endonuclease subunit S [Lactococcus reticulitermitis]GAX47038.1 hypothetical protein RsY01_619 [Lactococcus reticulitermitis]
MKKIKLSDLVLLVPGINPTRAKEQNENQEINYYDQNAFNLDSDYLVNDRDTEMTDIKQNANSLVEGTVLISNSVQLATKVGSLNAGKILSLNFTEVRFISDKLDKNYFLYLFNIFRDVQKQKEREKMGLTIQRIPIKALNDMVIPLPNLEKQKQIGGIYIESLKLQMALKRKSNLINQLTNEMLEKNMKDI